VHEWVDHILQVVQLVVMVATYLHHRKKVLDKSDPEEDRDYGDIGGANWMLCFRIPSDFERHWKHMLPFLLPAIERSNGRWTAEDVFHELQEARLQGWALMEDGLLYGVGLTSIHKYPHARVLRCEWLGGVEAQRWLVLLDKTVSEWAIREGCTHMEMIGRKGWERMGAVLGFKPSYVFFEKKLKDDHAPGRNDRAVEADFFDSAPRLPTGCVERPADAGAE
jgi:hypothetical protein